MCLHCHDLKKYTKKPIIWLSKLFWFDCSNYFDLTVETILIWLSKIFCFWLSNLFWFDCPNYFDLIVQTILIWLWFDCLNYFDLTVQNILFLTVQTILIWLSKLFWFDFDWTVQTILIWLSKIFCYLLVLITSKISFIFAQEIPQFYDYTWLYSKIKKGDQTFFVPLSAKVTALHL